MTGYLGSHVLENFIASGDEVTVLVRNDESARKAEARGLRTITAGLEDLDQLKKAAASHDAIIHTAASDDPKFFEVNKTAILSMLDSLSEGKSFTMQGGTGVFGDSKNNILSENSPFNPPPFLSHRAALEEQILNHKENNLKISIVYGSLVYGDGGGMIPQAILQSAKINNAASFIGSGNNRWSTVHVRDWAKLVVLAAKKKGHSREKYFAAADSLSMKELAEIVTQKLNLTTPPRSIDFAEAQKVFGFLAGIVSLSQEFSSLKAKEELGWIPKAPTLQESLLN